jgi:ketosteroid isomerase-like protein|tara:strand:+ start:253869 stop:254309 length:441 start_codon:yes stop_codon:yes gene_type:complete
MRIILLLSLLIPLSLQAQEKDTLETLFELDREFVQYRLENGTYKAFAKYLADDAVTLPPGAAPKVGLEAILRDASDKPNTTVTWEPSAGDISDNMGYTWGLFSINTAQDDGSVSKQHGKYASVWKRQENGEWKIVVDSFSLNPPPE